jgi:radical SAM protein with 4Fe4S-binding SPASM domain
MSLDIITKTGKRANTGEIIVTLFEFCNLSCKFCNQDHDSLEGVKTIAEKVDVVKKVIMQTPREKYSIHFMGGEVFADALPLHVYTDYQYVCHELNSWATEQDIELEICFTSNMVFDNMDDLDEFLHISNPKILTSFDPAARFNNDTFEIFKRNVKKYKDHIKSVNIIMTKPTINKFMKGDVEFFDYLYDNFDVYFDYYTPEKNMAMFIPNDVMLRDFMLYMLEHYPKALPFADYTSKIKKQMSCMDTVTIMPDNSFGNCTILLKDFKNVTTTKQDMEQEWFKQYSCLTCPHFQYCSMGCFLSNHMQSFRTQETCWLSEVYDVVHPDSNIQ